MKPRMVNIKVYSSPKKPPMKKMLPKYGTGTLSVSIIAVIHKMQGKKACDIIVLPFFSGFYNQPSFFISVSINLGHCLNDDV